MFDSDESDHDVNAAHHLIDELPVTDRAACLLKLCGGTQAQARQESFRKRPFDFPQGGAAPEEVEKKE